MSVRLQFDRIPPGVEVGPHRHGVETIVYLAAGELTFEHGEALEENAPLERPVSVLVVKPDELRIHRCPPRSAAQYKQRSQHGYSPASQPDRRARVEGGSPDRRRSTMHAALYQGTAGPLEETITLRQAKKLIQCMAHEQSFLFLSPPGAGKSEMVAQAAAEAGLPCRSLLGTQIAPEDVSGVPRIVGERSVFCPPRILLPENPEPFCLFLDELPACAPDVQKAFYSLLLERRLG